MHKHSEKLIEKKHCSSSYSGIKLNNWWYLSHMNYFY